MTTEAGARLTGPVAIVGLGLMGGSLAAALKSRRPDVELTGIDSDATTRQQATESGFFTRVGTSPDLADGCQLTVLAVPVTAMRPWLSALRDQLVTDLGSTKVDVCRWAAELEVDFVGGHPMCGREVAGFGAARADLFMGAAWALTSWHPLVLELVTSVGAVPRLVEATEHDAAVAAISHLPFLAACALFAVARASPGWPVGAALAAGGFRDATRLAAGDPGLYTSIVATNRDFIARELVNLEQAVRSVREAVMGDPAELHTWLGRVRDQRREWEAGS